VAATGLMHLLLVSTPRPFMFFAWIVSLLILVPGVARSAIRPRTGREG
jgi:hypothetical protein